MLSPSSLRTARAPRSELGRASHKGSYVYLGRVRSSGAPGVTTPGRLGAPQGVLSSWGNPGTAFVELLACKGGLPSTPLANLPRGILTSSRVCWGVSPRLEAPAQASGGGR